MKEYDQSGENQVSIQEFDLLGSPFEEHSIKHIDQVKISNFLSERFGFDNKNVLAVFGENNRAIIVVIESSKSDRVLEGILRQLKEAAKKQLSGSSPAVLCCHLADVTEAELLSVRPGTL